MNEKTFNRLFNYFLFFGMLACVVVASIINIRTGKTAAGLQIIVAFGSMMGITSTMLAANGNILNFVAGFVGACIETYVFHDNGLMAMFFLYLLYFIPMDVVGFFQWRKRGASAKKAVKAQRMTAKTWAAAIAGYIVVAAGAFGLSYAFADKSQVLNLAKMITDSLTMSATIVAIVMMTFAYMEQWYVWTLVNLSSIVLWSVTLATTPDSAYTVVMLIKYVFYLLNGLNAIRIWLKLSRKEEVLQD
mgnify:FL=1